MNVLSNILTIWARLYIAEQFHSKGKVLALTCQYMEVVTSADEIEWPKLELSMEEQSYIRNIPSDASLDLDGLIRMNGKFWIPREISELNLKILVSSHCRIFGHRGPFATLRIFRESFYWQGMEKTVSQFFNGWLHCKIYK